MPTASYVKYTSGVEFLVEGINAGSDAWKVALSNTVTIADTTFTPGTTDLATGNGYTAGGNAAATSTSGQAAGVFKLVLSSPATWTATGSVGPFRYAILWDSTTLQPIAYWDYGSSITLTSGDTFAVTLDGTNGVFTVGP
jgi:hypothetical protein